MKTLDEKIAVMTAYKNGARIESCANNTSIWLLSDEPTWDWYSCDYRVAEVQKVQPVERYALIRGAGCIEDIYFYKEDAKRDCERKGGRVALLREVLPPDPNLIRLTAKGAFAGGGLFLDQVVATFPPNRVIHVGKTIEFVEVTS